MASLIETLAVVAIIGAGIGGLAYVQSRSGEERREKYRTRMRRFMTLAFVCGILAAGLELWLRF